MNPLKAGVGRLAFVTACAALTTLSSNAIAAEEGEEPWKFEFTPYLFAAGLDGTTGVLGVTADIHVPVEKLVQQLDSAFMGNLVARKGDWFFAFDVFYVRLAGEAARSWQGPGGIGGATGELDATVSQQIYEPSLGYRAIDGRTTLDVVAAARYTRINTELNLITTSGGLLPGGTRSVSGSESWWDPVVGVRVTFPFAENWSAVGYVDAGGFGVGSDFTYQAMAGASWQFAKDYSAKAGYRYLHQEFNDGGFVWDMALKGFYFGLGIRF